MDWNAVAAILGVPIAAVATGWAIAREQSRVRSIERLAAVRNTVSSGSKAQQLSDLMLDEMVEEVYLRYVMPPPKGIFALGIVAAVLGIAIVPLAWYTFTENGELWLIIVGALGYISGVGGSAATILLARRFHRAREKFRVDDPFPAPSNIKAIPQPSPSEAN